LISQKFNENSDGVMLQQKISALTIVDDGQYEHLQITLKEQN